MYFCKNFNLDKPENIEMNNNNNKCYAVNAKFAV